MVSESEFSELAELIKCKSTHFENSANSSNSDSETIQNTPLYDTGNQRNKL